MRNKNIDIFRAGSLLLVMVYHCWILAGSQPSGIHGLTLILSLGGEIGVTAFFALSGYGIFCSLRNMDARGGVNYLYYLKKRIIRIIPQYYLFFFIFIMVLDASWLSEAGAMGVVTHLLFVHNLFPAYSGAINGVLWTMGVMMQFYLVAPLLYAVFKRYGLKAEILCVAGTIFAKYIAFSYVMPELEMGGEYGLFIGRQLITALDNFSAGMFVAYLVYQRGIQMRQSVAAGISFFSLVLTGIICKAGQMYGIHTNNISGYIWHSALVLALGGMMLGLSCLKLREDLFLYKFFLWIAQYEYSIYIWHFIVFGNLIRMSPWIQQMISSPYVWPVYLLMISVAVCVGYVFSTFEDSFLRKKH